MSNKKTNETVKEVMDEAKKAVEAIADAVEPAAKAVKSAAKSAAKKAEPAVKAAVSTAKDTGRKVSNAFIAEAYVQYGANEYDCQQIIESCKADFKASNRAAINSCRVYIKPEEGMAYYVINEIAGKITL